MTKPPIPADEARRLEALRSLELLDTPAEERFDRLTRLARKIFDVPIAILSLLDEDRQWFKSRQGLDVTETSREISFCGHTITHDRVLMVDDAAEDERFNDNPLVIGAPNIRFYAGCPINAPDASGIGALGIIDDRPRTLSEEQLVLLRDLGRLIDEEFVSGSPSTIDAASGLSNRLGMALIGKHLLAMCRRAERPACLVVVRFANLATVDESLGYSEGNRAVGELIEVLKAGFPNADLIGRVTIDGFGILFAGSTEADVEPSCDFLDELLSERNAGDADYELKIRTDTVTYRPGHHPSVEEMIREAEERLDNPRYDDVLEPMRVEAAV